MIVRGNHRQKTFLNPNDYQAYLERLGRYRKRWGVTVYAYCLMPNHVHLLLESGSQPLSRFMQGLQQSYTQYFNRKHRKIGHLFHGRYKAIIFDKDHKRYGIIDLESLSELSGITDSRGFQRARRQWAEQGLENGLAVRDDRWSEAIAVGSLAFVENVKSQLGVKAAHRDLIEADGSYALREPPEAYAGKFTGEIEALSSENTHLWNESIYPA